MTQATSSVMPDRSAAEHLRALSERLEQAQGFAELLSALRAGSSATIDGVWGSSIALVASSLAVHAPRALLVVCPHPDEVASFLDDLQVFTALPASEFPAWESLPADDAVRDETYGERLRILKLLRADEAPRLIVTSIAALLQPAPSPALLDENTRRLAVGEALALEEFTRWLAAQGFSATTAVELPGEYSLRGGILDLFAPDWTSPLRVELWGDQIESLRRFEVASQRSLESLQAETVTALGPQFRSRAHVADYLPQGSWILLWEPQEIEETARHLVQRLEKPDEVHSLPATLRQLYRWPSVTAAAVAPTSLETTCRLKVESVERLSGDVQRVRTELDAAAHGADVYLLCSTEAEVQRLGEVFADSQLAAQGRLHLIAARLRAGFRLVSERAILVSSSELFQRTDLVRPAARRRLGRALDSFLDLREGDYVVHVAHGVARYLGLRLLEKDASAEEHLELEFAEGVKLFVPVSRIELVQKYVGATKTRPKLARLGGKTWARQKQAAAQAVNDLARDMLELQAARAARPGLSFPADSDWQHEFDAAFPYTETQDQLVAIAALKQDMQLPRPMDRLICGDVGYGKTEVAMRAAFKAVDAGYQVAVLVPTTILAEQHGRTFRERFAQFPFQIAVLSRFCSAAEERKILAGLADGSVDIVIGTHRLAQADIAFHNVGLLIIDEEQRFGVQVKERLKAYRHVVDVLTLTATPIPRTLHMSLLGLRDISNLETPPADRLAIETRVARFDAELVRHAILRELNREGQVFFVHNRVHDIQQFAFRLQQIVPEALIGIAHGQMPETELEQVMLDFVQRKFDVLLATTIIESGLDIPNANTILIDRADRYGLAELHQLRGRVGRYRHRAYCYLLLDPEEMLHATAARRLKAIEEFSDMGAGFAIAMRDLEIRGAGNLLGTQQSGHISAVGYELYCNLLESAVRHLKRAPPKQSLDVALDLPGEAYFPRAFVPDQRNKIDCYRRLARVTAESELADLRGELVDRFGPLPAPVERMLARKAIQIAAQGWGVRDIHLEENYVVFRYADRGKMQTLASELRRKRRDLRIVDGESAYLPTSIDLSAAAAVEQLLKDVLFRS